MEKGIWRKRCLVVKPSKIHKCKKPTQAKQDTSVSEQDVEPEEPDETEDTNVIPNEEPENDTAPPSEPSQEEQIDILGKHAFQSDTICTQEKKKVLLLTN